MNSFSEFRLNSSTLGSGPVAGPVYIVMYRPFCRVRDTAWADKKLLTTQEELLCLQLVISRLHNINQQNAPLLHEYFNF